MEQLTHEDEIMLLKLARSAIESRLLKDVAIQRPESIGDRLSCKRGCFVTLHKKGELRGCIGIIEPVKALIDAVEENALHAAFRDPRFEPLQSGELNDITIEISVLSVPEVIPFSDSEDLKRKLKPGVHGVILSRGYHSATFLPQVWDQLSDKNLFLTHLCLKAGMEGTCWKTRDVIVKTYTAHYFSE